MLKPTLHMPLDDEMPQAPGTGDSSSTTTTTIEDECDASIYEGIPDRPEEIPIGVYVFRLDSYEERVWPSGDPYYNLKLVCQQEPLVGRVLFDSVNAAKPEDLRDAADPSSPRNAEARKALKDLWKQQAMMKAAGFKPKGKGFSFKNSFLALNPEFKIKVKHSPEREDTGQVDGNGKKIYRPTGNVRATVGSYLPLV